MFRTLLTLLTFGMLHYVPINVMWYFQDTSTLSIDPRSAWIRIPKAVYV